MTVNSLAKLLDGFAIKSKQFRLDNDIRYRGYKKGFFTDSFKRYLSTPPGIAPSKRDSVIVASGKATSSIRSVTTSMPVTDTRIDKPLPSNGCHGVTDGNGLNPVIERIVFDED